MAPGSGRDDFDLICLPTHDQPKHGPNTMVVVGAPHGMTPSRLEEAATEWSARLATCATPRIAVMIGGSTRRRTFTAAMGQQLCQQVNQIATTHHGSLMVTTSRRTGDVVDTIADALDDKVRLYRWDSNDDNPYVGYLALADAIIVTGESVSMCSEACGTGKPVYIYAPSDLITPKHGRLHQALYDGGYAKPFDGGIDLNWHPKRLNVADEIAAEIRRRGLNLTTA